MLAYYVKIYVKEVERCYKKTVSNGHAKINIKFTNYS